MNFTRNLTQDMTHKLGVMIIKGEYSVNQRMPSEALLCEQFNVSRSATREAVKMLAAKGLISSRPKQGITVLPESQWNLFDKDVLSWILQSKPSLSLLKEFTQVRYAIEPVAALVLARLSANETSVPLEMEATESPPGGSCTTVYTNPRTGAVA